MGFRNMVQYINLHSSHIMIIATVIIAITINSMSVNVNFKQHHY